MKHHLQQNMYDCGVFTCMWACQLGADLPLDNICQTHMAAFRYYIAGCLKEQLLPGFIGKCASVAGLT